MRAAEAVLRVIVALLPQSRSEWGRAMRAELASLDSTAVRRRFVVGCLRATLAQIPLRRYAGPLLSALAVGAAVVATAITAYRPLRLTLIAYAVLLVAIAWSGRLPSLATTDRHGARVRFCGAALVGVFAVRVVTGLRAGGDPSSQATTGVPIMAAISVCYLAAVLLVTAGSGPASGAAAVGGTLGLATAGFWMIGVLIFPPVPAGIVTALLAISAAALAGAVTNRRGVEPVHLITATMSAVATCALVVNVAVGLIARLAPVRFIPLLANDGSMPQVSRIAQSRTELNDPYIAVILIGAVAAIILITTFVAARRTAAHQPIPVAEGEAAG